MKEISSGIVRLNVVKKSYSSVETPWIPEFTDNYCGTGFIIANNIIVTCAHISYNSPNMSGILANSDEIYEFETLYTVPAWDIALITTKSVKFWSQVQPLQLGMMSNEQDKIQVVGFPFGSENMRITEGIISGYQFEKLAFSGRNALLMQIDVSINGGNSGGPVIYTDAEQENTVIGMVCQGRTGEGQQAQSFALPVNLIKKVINKYKNNSSNQIPALDLDFQRLQHESTRVFLKLPYNIKGVRVTAVNPYACYSEKIQVGDVIVAIDNKSISNSGKVAMPFCKLIDWQFIASMRDIDDNITLTILRNNVLFNETIFLNDVEYSSRMPEFRFTSEQPTFFFYNGILFSSFSMLPGENINSLTLAALINKYRTEECLDAVYINKIFGMKHTNGLELQDSMALIANVNGRKIRHIGDLIECLAQDVKAHEIISDNGTLIVVPATTNEANQYLAKQYGLTDFRSEDLQSKDLGLYFSRFPKKLQSLFLHRDDNHDAENKDRPAMCFS